MENRLLQAGPMLRRNHLVYQYHKEPCHALRADDAPIRGIRSSLNQMILHGEVDEDDERSLGNHRLSMG